MADATPKDLKDFFAHVPDLDPVSNNQLLELADWFTDHTGTNDPTPNDFIRYIHKTFSQQVRSRKRVKLEPVWGP